MSWFHLVPGRVVGLVSLVLRHCVPSWFPPSFLLQLGFRGLFPYFSFLSFLRKRIVFHRDFLGPSGSGLGFPGFVSLLFFRFFFQKWGTQWILYCAWTSWKYGLLLFGVYAGVILFEVKGTLSLPPWPSTFWTQIFSGAMSSSQNMNFSGGGPAFRVFWPRQTVAKAPEVRDLGGVLCFWFLHVHLSKATKQGFARFIGFHVR